MKPRIAYCPPDDTYKFEGVFDLDDFHYRCEMIYLLSLAEDRYAVWQHIDNLERLWVIVGSAYNGWESIPQYSKTAQDVGSLLYIGRLLYPHINFIYDETNEPETMEK